MTRSRVVALVGPTAAGKSALALEAAAEIGAEIVAVDAFTVYRGLDVGTAKPSQADRERVPHHLVDVLDPSTECTVQWFQSAARLAIADIHARGRIALLVGGSGLYFRAVVDPLEFPPTDPGVRTDLEQRFGTDPAGAHAALSAVDPAAAERIGPRNARRAIRALEVHELTGRPFSSWRRAWDEHESVYGDLAVVGVDLDRDKLRSRIVRRVQHMLQHGLVEEAEALRGRPLSSTARQAIGYREIWDHLDGAQSLDEAREQIIARTRRFAVRQQRWFAADPRVRWRAPADVPQALRDGRGS